jgi:dCMP deaminase
MTSALAAAAESPDPSSQTGSVILDAAGRVVLADHNRFPAGVDHSAERWERPLKYSFIEHAERNAIFSAARRGVILEGATLVCTWVPCADCARAIVQVGIKTFVCPREPGDSGNWTDGIAIGETILREAGVNIVELEPSELGTVPPLRRNGQPWLP